MVLLGLYGTTQPRMGPQPVHGRRLTLPSHPAVCPFQRAWGSYHLPEPVLVERDHHHGGLDQVATFIEGEVPVLPCHIEKVPGGT